VTMTVQPPSDWGKLTGVVTGVDCQSKITALRGATVQVNGKKGWTFTLKADQNGRYAIWAPAGANPLQVIVARDGWIPQTQQLSLTGGKTVTADFALRPQTCCPGLDPPGPRRWSALARPVREDRFRRPPAVWLGTTGAIASPARARGRGSARSVSRSFTVSPLGDYAPR
jgi:hypothetical protein